MHLMLLFRNLTLAACGRDLACSLIILNLIPANGGADCISSCYFILFFLLEVVLLTGLTSADTKKWWEWVLMDSGMVSFSFSFPFPSPSSSSVCSFLFLFSLLFFSVSVIMFDYSRYERAYNLSQERRFELYYTVLSRQITLFLSFLFCSASSFVFFFLFYLLPIDSVAGWVHHAEGTHRDIHNLYGMLMARSTYEGSSSLPPLFYLSIFLFNFFMYCLSFAYLLFLIYI